MSSRKRAAFQSRFRRIRTTRTTEATAHAFRKAGRQRRYRDAIMVTTLAPCWYRSSLIVQLQNIGEV
jgi:deoxycytidylate deaminase